MSDELGCHECVCDERIGVECVHVVRSKCTRVCVFVCVVKTLLCENTDKLLKIQ